MGLGGILQRLKTEGVILVYHDHRSGTLYDFSGNSRTGIPYSANFFTPRAMNTYSTVTVTNDATLQATTVGTIIVRQTCSKAQVTSYFARKSTQFFFLYSLGTSRYQLSANGVTVELIYNASGVSTHAVEFDNAGGTPKGYVNGVFLGNYSGGLTSVPDAANLWYGYGSSTDEPQNVEYFLFISRKLSAAEHQELYQQLQALS